MRHVTLAGLVFAVFVTGLGAADTPKAAVTREKLKQKISVEYKDSKMSEIKDDLEEKVKDLRIMLDTKGGVSQNLTMTYKAADKPVEEVLDEMFKKNDMGYVVISQQNNAYDGLLKIVKGKNRGYETGKEPDKTAVKKEEPEKKPVVKEKPDPEKKPAVKVKPDPEKKPAVKEKPEPKDEPKPKVEDTDDDRTERLANIRLKVAKSYIGDGKTDDAKEECEKIIKKYPKTKAAEEAKKLLQKMN